MSDLVTATGAVIAAPVRRHDMNGVYNLRDTGGYPAADGMSRWGTLFRSDALHRLDEAGRARLAELGITHIIDLRGDDERAEAPSALDELSIRVHHIPVFDQTAPAVTVTVATRLDSIYDHIVDLRGGQLVQAIRLIADATPGDAVLVHCTAGKDRTGLVVAFALRAAGVERSAVVEDYAATAANLHGVWADEMLAGLVNRGVEPTPDIVALLTASPAALLEQLLDRIDAEYGSITGYLRANGFTTDELTRLRVALVSDQTQERNDA